MQTLGGVIAEHVRRAPDATALWFEGRETSYALLQARAGEMADHLATRGVGAGDRIGYLGKNSDAYFVLLMALAALRAVLVPINWRLSAEEWRFIGSDSGTRLLFTDREFLDRATILASALHIPPPELLCDMAGQGGAARRDESVPDDVVVQIYTSGTTGRPKGALLTHRNLLALRSPGYRAGLAWFPGGTDSSLLVLPVSHIAGTAYGLFGLYGGGRVVITREFDAGVALRLIEEQRATHMLLAPAALQIMLEHSALPERDLSSLKYLTYGASPIPEALLDRAITVLSCGFVQMYGMTEASGGVVALSPEDHVERDPRRLRSAGRAMPGAEIAVADVEGRHLSRGETGELLVRSAAVMKGYWNRPEGTAETIDADGWLRTGDIGMIDGDGYVFVLDRAKDMIISGGENIYPAEVENVLFGHPDIAEVAVFGAPSERWGEEPVAAVVMRERRTPDADALAAWCDGKIARFKIPKRYHVVAELPRNAGNKVLRRELRATFSPKAGGS